MRMVLRFPEPYVSGPDAGSNVADALRALANQVEGFERADFDGSAGAIIINGQSVGTAFVEANT